MNKTRTSKKSNKKPYTRAHVKKGDTVVITTGKDRGKTGLVKKVLLDQHRVVVEGLNMVKKAVRPVPMLGQMGGIIEKEAPIHLSNVMFYDLQKQQATRLGRQVINDAAGKVRRVRVSKKTGEQVDV